MKRVLAVVTMFALWTSVNPRTTAALPIPPCGPHVCPTQPPPPCVAGCAVQTK
jgi:hypothetical protein